jgi:hypothetical protein
MWELKIQPTTLILEDYSQSHKFARLWVSIYSNEELLIPYRAIWEKMA